jgi:50S ribosomal subunit-associated GTPase HflX
VQLVLNKADRLDPVDRARLVAEYPGAAVLSALNGEGVEALTAAVAARLSLDTQHVTLEFDVGREADRARIAWLYRVARVLSHRTDGTRAALEVSVARRWLDRLSGPAPDQV